MKVAFYYSATANAHQNETTIDGIPYTEIVSFEDHEEVKPWSNHDDNELIMVVENVNTTTYLGDLKTADIFTGQLAGRIKLN